ncbi:twin-arginine translocation signal domain-containing protein [Halobaculum sp. WSA2]|uniref:Twin-arginine translocation signal domain-containing protein n=1 Tax=Halobaculum saliterrae TaxID=2073113 RepID=A0A6B0SZU2_9EURY|nr:twin-arginine translocation signal domain-containing protein [Halobaculum saliterrae]MXR39919.1 twin-arginine translocation signal domain-containing protein [Halobaculum saliterrae]
MDRRQFLRTTAATGIAAVIGGCGGSGADSDQPRPSETAATPFDTPSTSTPGRATDTDRFDSVVDLAEAGADADRSLVPHLERHLADDTMVYLPAGRYRMDDTVRLLSFDNVGIVGDGAVIVPPDGFDSTLFDLGRPGRASNLLFEGITFDFGAPDTGSRPVSALVDDGLVIRDLAVVGRQDAGRAMLRADVTDADGTGLVERLRLPDGAAYETQSTAFLVGDRHRGELRFEDCRIVGFPDNGLYADPDHGRVEVVGGYYANCDISNVRVGNDSVVRGVHVRNDTASSGYENMRGIRATHGDGVLIEDCTVELERVPASEGGLVMSSQLTAGTVRNTRIEVDADGVSAIRAKSPDDALADGELVFEDIAVRGTAANGAAIEMLNREDCTFDRATVVQSGASRDGFLFDYVSNGVIRDSRIDVTGRPVVSADRASVQVSDSHPPEVNTSR